MSVPTVLSYVASLREVYSVRVMMVIFWMKMEYHVMVCFSIVKLHYKLSRNHYSLFVTNNISNIQLHVTYVTQDCIQKMINI